MARWLLMIDDRVAADCLKVTYDFLSMVLGTDGASVTVAARNLQRQGIIQYNRGTLRILRRKRLEDLGCECYAAIQHFDHDLGLPNGPLTFLEYAFCDADGRRPHWGSHFVGKYGDHMNPCDEGFYKYWFGGAFEAVFPDWPS